MKPPLSILSAKGLTAYGLFMVKRSPARAVLASDDDDWSWESLVETAYPQLLLSVARRGITPEGVWVVVLEENEQWRELIGSDTRANVEAAMAADPRIRVLGVAHLVDSEDVQMIDIPNEN